MSNETIASGQWLEMSYEDKVDMIIKSPASAKLPEEAAILCEYLAQYRPLLPPRMADDNHTSVSIAETMCPIIELDTKLISSVMRMLGYRLFVCGDGLPEWSMIHVDCL